MRTISSDEQALLNATVIGGRATFARFKIKDSGGTFRDLTTYGGLNLLISAKWSENIDSPGMEADVELKREVEKLSLSPYMAASGFNHGFSPSAGFAKLIDIGREVQLDVAMVPEGQTPASGDWKLAFHGYVDEMDPASDEHVTLRCSDLQARLRDTWIERERSYAHAQGVNATKGCTIWRENDGPFVVGALGIPTEANRNGHFYAVDSITTGITGSSEPSWPTGSGATVVDGGVTWKEKGSTSMDAGTPVETVIQQILDDNLGAGVVTLNVPSSPGWDIKAYKQDRESVWDAIRKLVDQIAWDLRYRWDSGSSSFKLTLSLPDRGFDVFVDPPYYIFGPGDRFKLRRLQTQIAFIRNAVRVWYSDSSDLDASQIPRRKFYESASSGSISAYGRRFMEIAEADTSQIDSAAEAQTLADSCVADLATPICEHEADVPLFRFIELGDYYQWSADNVHYDSAQVLAVVGYSHQVGNQENSAPRTTITCRGKASAGFRRWLSKGDRDIHAKDLHNTGGIAATVTETVGGMRVEITGREHKGALTPEYEVHVDTSSSFTPSSSTLVAQGSQTSHVIPDLVPGKTHYLKVVPRGHNRSQIVKGEPSAEVSFVAGRASAGHIAPGIALGDYPLNGGFETRLDAGDLPDHWTLYSGSYGTNVAVVEDGNGMSGNRYLRLLGGGIQSASFPMIQEAMESSRRGSIYRFSWWRKAGSSASAYSALIRLADYQDNDVDILTVSSSMPVTHAGHWVQEELFVRLKEGDSTSRTIQLRLSGGGTGANQQIEIDEVRCQYLGSAWLEVGDTTYFTPNYEAVPGYYGPGGWGNDTGFPVAFRKSQFGELEFRGAMAGGTIGVKGFTLPTGFRPQTKKRVAVICGFGTVGELDIDTNGDVTVAAGDNSWVSLDNIRILLTDVATTTT